MEAFSIGMRPDRSYRCPLLLAFRAFLDVVSDKAWAFCLFGVFVIIKFSFVVLDPRPSRADGTGKEGRGAGAHSATRATGKLGETARGGTDYPVARPGSDFKVPSHRPAWCGLE
jgi:hypothetical protein